VQQVSAVPTQALPMVSGICGRISMIRAVQKSCRVGLMNCMGVGPMENAPALKPPRTKPEKIPAARATRAAGNFLLSRSPNTRAKTTTR